MTFLTANSSRSRGATATRRIALSFVALLLLLQAVPALACLAMPGSGMGNCCCEIEGKCVSSREADCTTSDACCVEATASTPALSVVAAHDENRSVVPVSVPGVPPATDFFGLIQHRAQDDTAQFIRVRTSPLPSVPLYLRHLRLTL